MPLVAMAMVLSAAAAPAQGSLHLSARLDQGLPCPANAQLEQAIKVRLPKLRFSRGRFAPPDLAVELSAAGAGFRFEVRRADGTVAMTRDLFSGCEQLGDLAALILERYLAQISWAGSSAGLVPESPRPPRAPGTGEASKPTPPPVVSLAPAPVIAAGASADSGVAPPAASTDAGLNDPKGPDPTSAELIARIGVARSSPTEPADLSDASSGSNARSPTDRSAAQAADAGRTLVSASPVEGTEANGLDGGTGSTLAPPASLGAAAAGALAFEVGVGVGPWYGDRLALAGSIDVALLIRQTVKISVLGMVGTPNSRLVPDTGVARGSVQSFDGAAFGALGLCSSAALRVCGSLAGGARWTSAAASTNPAERARLFRTSTAVIAVPELAATLQVNWFFRPRWFVGAQALVGVPLIRGALVVQGFDPLLNPLLDVALLLRLGFST